MTEEDLKHIAEIEVALQKYQDTKKKMLTYEDKPLNESTIKTYKNTFSTLLRKAEKNGLAGISSVIIEAKNTPSKNTWYKRRAALIYCFNEMIESKIENLYAGKVNLDINSKSIMRSLLRGFIEVTSLNEMPVPTSDRTKRRSKRSHLRGLPDNWRLQIFNRMPSYQLQIATLILCGCRPIEVVRGVEWRAQGDTFIARIKGAKITTHAGQEYRELTFKPSCEVSKFLFDRIQNNNGKLLVTTSDARKLTDAIRSAGRRAFPKHPHEITAYCFRHQFAGDLKGQQHTGEDLVTDDEISQALGHCASRTKGYYGHPSQSRGGVCLLQNVTATRMVKQRNDRHPGARKYNYLSGV